MSLENFTFKKLLVLIVILGIAVLCFLGFEAYTSHFYYDRAGRQADLLEQLVTIRESHQLTEQEAELRDELLTQLRDRDVTSASPTSSGYSFPWDKFIYGMIPWLLMSLITLFQKKLSNRSSTFLGFGLYGAILGLFATLSPFDGFIMKLFVTPLLLIALAIVFTAIVTQVVMQRAKAKTIDESHPEA